MTRDDLNKLIIVSPPRIPYTAKYSRKAFAVRIRMEIFMVAASNNKCLI